MRPLLTFLLPFAAGRVRLQLAMAYMAIADHNRGAHRLVREIDDILTVRPALGSLVDEVEALRASLATTTLLGTNAVSPLTPAELRLLPLFADPSHRRRHRRPVVRVDQHDQLPARLDLPQARCVVAPRRRPSGDGGRTPRRLSGSQTPSGSNAAVVSCPNAKANFGGTSTTRGRPTIGETAEQDVDL